MSWTDQHQMQETAADDERAPGEALDEWVREGEPGVHHSDNLNEGTNSVVSEDGTRHRDTGTKSGETAAASNHVASASVATSDTPLSMAQCPRCDSREFVSKKLVYEEFHYTETGELEHHQNKVRAEFEYTCMGCQNRLHELPTGARSYYTEVAVLRDDLRRAMWVQVRAWFDSLANLIRMNHSESNG